MRNVLPDGVPAGTLRVTAPFSVTPLQGLTSAAGSGTSVVYQQGLPADDSLAAIPSPDLSPAYSPTPFGGSYTGTLTVRMRRPTPLNRRLDYEAGVDRVEGRKIFVWGRCHDGDELLAEAEIVFISPRDGSVPR